jgi:hypothetical protein
MHPHNPLPVDPAAIAAALAAPFSDDELKYRPGHTWEEQGARWTKPLVYVDVRTVVTRLDAVLGIHGWSSEIVPVGTGVYAAKLTVHALGGITRTDVGQAGEHESEKEKAGVSDAIKRAAVQLGVGRYLYSLEVPKARVEQHGGGWRLPYGWRPGAPDPTHAPQPVPGPAPNGRGITPAQFNRIQSDLARLGLTAEQVVNRPLTDLSKSEASRLIDMLSGNNPQTAG